MFAWRNNKFWQRIYYHCINVDKHFGVKKSNEKNVFVHELLTVTIVGKLSIDKNSTPGSRTNRPLFRALKYILSPCIKTLLNVVNDHADNGIFRAVRSADKLIKAHCLPLE